MRLTVASLQFLLLGVVLAAPLQQLSQAPSEGNSMIKRAFFAKVTAPHPENPNAMRTTYHFGNARTPTEKAKAKEEKAAAKEAKKIGPNGEPVQSRLRKVGNAIMSGTTGAFRGMRKGYKKPVKSKTGETPVTPVREDGAPTRRDEVATKEGETPVVPREGEIQGGRTEGGEPVPVVENGGPPVTKKGDGEPIPAVKQEAGEQAAKKGDGERPVGKEEGGERPVGKEEGGEHPVGPKAEETPIIPPKKDSETPREGDAPTSPAVETPAIKKGDEPGEAPKKETEIPKKGDVDTPPVVKDVPEPVIKGDKPLEAMPGVEGPFSNQRPTQP